MRKNETPADPELCHICLSLKNCLFHKAGAGGHHVHTKYAGNVKNDRSFTQAPHGGRARPSSASSPAWGGGPARLFPAAAVPCAARLVAPWSQAASLSLSGTDPLPWQPRGAWGAAPLLRLCPCPAPASRGLPRRWLGIWANFCCQNMNPGQCFCEATSSRCVFSMQWVCTQTE